MATLVELDVRVFLLLHGALSGVWLWPMVGLSALGGGWGALGLAPFLFWTGPRTRRLARSLALVFGATAIAVFVLKQIVRRPRPFHSLDGVHALVFDPPADFSFPSGHAAGSFAFAVFAAVVLIRTRSPAHGAHASAGSRGAARWAASATLILFACGVGLSRIALGVHYPGDVLGGAVLGSFAGGIGAKLYLAKQ